MIALFQTTLGNWFEPFAFDINVCYLSSTLTGHDTISSLRKLVQHDYHTTLCQGIDTFAEVDSKNLIKRVSENIKGQ